MSPYPAGNQCWDCETTSRVWNSVSPRRRRRHVYNFDEFPTRKWPLTVDYIFNDTVPTVIDTGTSTLDYDDDKWSKLSDEKVASPPHTDGSIVFVRWRQRAPNLMHDSDSLGPPEFKSQTASRSVQPFLHSSRQTVAMLHNWPTLFPLIIAHSHGGSELPSNT